ncbi:MAG: TRAP transporter large permease subunit [Clostridium sp.]
MIIALLLTMLCCIVLGMGVPTTATYCIMAATCAPILMSKEIGVEMLAAHFFVFYFGIVADITPPVALAAYAGAAIAKSTADENGDQRQPACYCGIYRALYHCYESGDVIYQHHHSRGCDDHHYQSDRNLWCGSRFKRFRIPPDEVVGENPVRSWWTYPSGYRAAWTDLIGLVL